MPLNELRQQFISVIKQDEFTLSLDRAALLIAAHEYPRLAIETYLQKLDLLATEISIHLTTAQKKDPLSQLELVASYLFRSGRFIGNQKNYYDIRNSFLHEVLDRGTGIPITLSVIFIEIARRLNIRLFGVGFPGHFLVKYCGEQGEIFFAPFHSGRILTEEDCRLLLQQTYNGQLPFQTGFLHAFTKKQILWRMLQNLKGIYLQAEDFIKAAGVIDCLLLLDNTAVEEIRDRGLINFTLKRRTQAQIDLNQYLKLAPNAPDKEKIRQALQEMREQQALLN